MQPVVTVGSEGVENIEPPKSISHALHLVVGQLFSRMRWFWGDAEKEGLRCGGVLSRDVHPSCGFSFGGFGLPRRRVSKRSPCGGPNQHRHCFMAVAYKSGL